MRKISVISIAFAAIAMLSCTREHLVENTKNVATVSKTFSASMDDVKAYINDRTVLWDKSDKVAIYDGVSLKANTFIVKSGEGTGNAVLSGEVSQRATSFIAVSPESVAKGLSENKVKVTIPSVQTAGEKNIDESALVMVSKYENGSLAFKNVYGVFKITVDVEGIRQIRIRTNDGSALAGSVIVNPSSGESGELTGASSEVVLNPQDETFTEGVYYVPVLPVTTSDKGITVNAYTTLNTVYEKKGTKSLALPRNLQIGLGRVGAVDPVALLSVEVCESTSSTACFEWWTEGKETAEYVNEPYTFQCSASEDFSNATEYTVAGGNGTSVWDNRRPKFCFSGLNQDTRYYFRVRTGDGPWSDVVSSKTKKYDKTVVSENVKAGDVILAEDFAALNYYGDISAKAAGYHPVEEIIKDRGNSYTIANADEKHLPESLKDWGFARGLVTTGPANLYANAGHFKLGTAYAQSYLVTPELNAIPVGKVATLEVELTVAVPVYGTDTSDKTNVKNVIISSETGTMSRTNMFTCFSAFSNKVEIDLTEDKETWNTYTVSLLNVMRGDRLMISADKNAAYNRLLVSDVRATITAMEPVASALVAKPAEVSSSTVSFTWGDPTKSASQNANCAYEFGLYKDKDCTDLVVSYRIDAQPYSDKLPGTWNGRKPKFCFGGLDPNTTYYFKVKDTDANRVSGVVSATTSAFTNIIMPTTVAKANDIILAEDFSEVILGGEPVIAAAAACVKNDIANVYDKPSGPFNSSWVFNRDVDEQNLTDSARDKTRLKDWSYAFNSGSSMYAHVGCIKLGTSSNNTWLTTPVLSAIPDGKTADLEITVTLAAYDKTLNTAYVYAGNIGEAKSITEAKNMITSSGMSIVVGTWNTYTIKLSGVDKTKRLIIGPDTVEANAPKGKGRMVVNDIKVKITALK